MPFIPTEIEGSFIFEPKVFYDSRGYFFETFNASVWEKQGITRPFIQDNEALSTKGVLRGLHFQKNPYAQAKLVRASQGTVLDIIVDIRLGSPSYGKHIIVELSAENKRQLYVPRGCAHGYAVLSDTAVFAYKCDGLYHPQSEGDLNIFDADLGIQLPELGIPWQLSEKDQDASSFTELEHNFTWEEQLS